MASGRLTTNGRDVIWAVDGRDFICTGRGYDLVYAGLAPTTSACSATAMTDLGRTRQRQHRFRPGPFPAHRSSSLTKSSGEARPRRCGMTRPRQAPRFRCSWRRSLWDWPDGRDGWPRPSEEGEGVSQPPAISTNGRAARAQNTMAAMSMLDRQADPWQADDVVPSPRRHEHTDNLRAANASRNARRGGQLGAQG